MFPKFIKIRQTVPAPRIDDIIAETTKVIEALHPENFGMKGKKIGITAGSRGITGIPKIIAAIAAVVRKYEGEPVIVAAMGSHGGAVAEGQRNILSGLDITENSVGTTVLCCADAIQIGQTDAGIPVYCNSEAAKLDGLIICNRIKPHTDFSGEIESGLCKMMVIGLGNHKGAATAHYYAVNNGYPEMIRASAEVVMKNLPILFGLGIVENWKNEPMLIRAVDPQNFVQAEMDMLKLCKDSSLKLPFKKADVLIVGELGKNISGAGMDTKVIGRIRTLGQREPEYPKITNIVVLHLTEASHGNATGIGLADYTTERLFNMIDMKATTINGLTSMSPDQIRLPVILETEKEAIEWACKTLGLVKENNLTMAYIKNTMELETLAVSENMLDYLEGSIELLGAPKPLEFAHTGVYTGKLLSPLD